MKQAPEYDEGSDLFSRHESASLEANLAYMARTHGFFIPYLDYVTDLQGLLGYLLEMVYVGNVALVSGRQFHTLEAVQARMRATNGCRMELEGHEEEYADFYDLEALAARSPLWEWVEEEGEEEEDDEEGWEDDDDDDEEEGAAEGWRLLRRMRMRRQPKWLQPATSSKAAAGQRKRMRRSTWPTRTTTL